MHDNYALVELMFDVLVRASAKNQNARQTVSIDITVITYGIAVFEFVTTGMQQRKFENGYSITKTRS